VIIERALRDEGTSYHYAPPAEYAQAIRHWWPRLPKRSRAKASTSLSASWTTDAPFRETAEAIEAARSKGILAVEMEAAALYTFARAAGVQVLCLAHVTNTMGQTEQDFEKGEANGTADALRVVEAIIELPSRRGHRAGGTACLDAEGRTSPWPIRSPIFGIS